MFEQFTIYDVMYAIGLDTSRLRSSGSYYDCPICGGKKKFNVNPTVGHGGVCRCARCSAGGDKLDLYVLYRMRPMLVTTASSSGGSYYQKPSERDRKDGMIELARELRLSRNNPEYIKKSHDVQKKVEETAKEDDDVAPPEQRNAVYTAFLRVLSLSAAHRDMLKGRGLTDSEIEQIQFRSTPMFGRTQLVKKLLGQGLQLDRVPGFFKTGAMQVDAKTGEAAPEWSVYCPDSGYFIPIRDMYGNIVSMQVRLNKPTTAKDKYRFFSSYRETLDGGVAARSEIHVEMCSQSPKLLYIVEGPIKGHVSHALYKRIFKKDDVVLLCIVGTSNFGKVPALMEHLLTKYDIENVVEFYDLDKFTNEYVARDRKNLEGAIKECLAKLRNTIKAEYENGKPKPMFISFPRDKYLGKGIDDHLLALAKKKEE